MAILAECPICKRKQGIRNKVCSCGENLDQAKKSKRVRYWIAFYLPGKKKRRELVGYSIDEARAAMGKRRAQKKENRIFDMLPESKMTFEELAKWYLDLKTVKNLSSYKRVKQGIDAFNAVLGDYRANEIKPVDLENYQLKREEESRAPATIDMEISLVKTMVIKAFDNDMLDGRILKAFRGVKRKLKSGGNARKRLLSFMEYLRVLDEAAGHLKPILITAYHTGMRTGELRGLTWPCVDRERGFIRLSAKDTKEKRAKNIPINHHVEKVLNGIPRALHHDHVFTYRGEPIKAPGGLRKSFRNACIKAGITHGRDEQNGLTFHDIRRTVKTNMLEAGIDKTHRDIILGHSLIGMDVHYLAPTEETLKKAMDKYTAWLDEKLGGISSEVGHKVGLSEKKASE